MGDVLDRERMLIEEIQTRLPEFVNACCGKEDRILIHQDAFAPKLGSGDMFPLGKAIKYAGLMGKEVRIIPSLPS